MSVGVGPIDFWDHDTDEDPSGPSPTGLPLRYNESVIGAIEGGIAVDPSHRFKRDIRREDRSYCAHKISVLATEGICSAALLDISRSGFRAAVDMPELVGDTVRMLISDGRTLQAVVVWQKRDEIGCKFDDPVSKMTARAIFQGHGLSKDQTTAIGYGDANAPGR